jgi:hypothetical protein
MNTNNLTNKIFKFFSAENTPETGNTPKPRTRSLGGAKGKELTENISDNNNISIINNNENFNFDLKVHGRSIFQQIVLTAEASMLDKEGIVVPIPIKCSWKRVKNDTLIDINDINSNSYIPTAEDIGYIIEVHALPVDAFGTSPAVARYGPILLDTDIKSTLELLLTSGGTKFSLNVFDINEQEKVNNKEIIIYVNSNELRLAEVDYNGREKQFEQAKYHQLNPVIKLHPYDIKRFSLRFYEFEVGDGANLYNVERLGLSLKAEYHLIAMSKQCREIIYLLIQCFLLDEKIKNNKLFTSMNYNLLPQETKVGITDMISEIKTLREENSTILNNMKILQKVNRDLKREMKNLEEDFQISLESINSHISGMNGNGNNNVQQNNTNNTGQNIYSSRNTKLIPNNNTEMKKKCEELLSINSLLVSKEKALREENKDLQLNSVIVKNKCEELEIDNKKLSNQVVNLELEIKSLKKTVSMLNDEVKKEKSLVQLQKEQNEILTKEKEILSKKMSTNDNEEILNSKLAELQKLNEKINFDNKNLISQRNILTNQKDVLSKEVEKLTKENKSLNEKFTQISADKNSHEKQQKESETIIFGLNSKLENLTKENKELKNKLEILEVEFSTIKKNNEDFMLQTNGLISLTQDEYEEYDQLKREKDENEAILMQLKSNNQAKDFEIQRLKQQIEKLQNFI